MTESFKENLLVGLVLLIIGGIITYITNKLLQFYKQPKLSIQFKTFGTGSTFIQLSPSNPANKAFLDGILYTDNRNALCQYELTTECEITITNTSEHIAYFPKFVVHENKIWFYKARLDDVTPILAHDKILVKAYYREVIECFPANRPDVNYIPETLKNMKIVLCYKNTSNKELHTIYDVSTKNNKYLNELTFSKMV